MFKSEGAALRKVDASVKGIMGAVQGVVAEVRELKYGKREKKVWPGQKVYSWGNAEKKVEKEMRKEGVLFESGVEKDNGGESWFPTKEEVPSLLLVIPPIASDITSGK